MIREFTKGKIRKRTENLVDNPGKVTRTRFGQWNVMTLYQAGKLPILTAECERLNIDVLGMSEVRWNGSGEERAGNDGLLIYSGMPNDDDPHIRGVGIYLSKRFKKALMSWRPVSERILTARIQTRYNIITIVQAYAPTDNSSIEDKESFYSLLDKTLTETPTKDTLLMMGDFNAQIGCENQGYEHIMGKHGLGSCTENGDLFLELCLNHDLKIGGSIFPHKKNHKTTWKSPRGNAENQIDHICISRSDCNIICDVRNKRSAEIGSDHHLLVAEMKLTPKFRRKPVKQINKQYDVQKLKDDNTLTRFKESIRCINATNYTSCENMWSHIKESLQNICKNTLGFKKNEQKEWMSPESWRLIEKRREIKIKMLCENDDNQRRTYDDTYKSLSKQIKLQIKKDKSQYYDNLGEMAQTAANKGDTRQLFNICRDLSQSKSAASVPIEDENGRKVTDKKEQLEVWKRHFERTLNTTHDNATDAFIFRDHHNINMQINNGPPSAQEIESAINRMKNGKAPGNDGLPIECFKADPAKMSSILHPLFTRIWDDEILPEDWKEAIIVKLPKKGDRKKCNNWRGISLLPTVSKIFTQVILNRIESTLNGLLRKNQAGFRQGRSCIDHINTARIIIEQASEFNATLYMCFIDYEKAFDSLRRDYIWSALQARGIPPKIVNILKNSYEGVTCSVLHEGELSDKFQSLSGVRQGCALSPLLFITVLDAVFDNLQTDNCGINWKFNKRLCDLEYADDVMLLSNRYVDMQNIITNLDLESRKIGLKINIAKTKTMRINTPHNAPFTINGQDVEETDHFEYLGSMLAKDGGTKHDVESRLRKAKANFARLRNIWRSPTIRTKTKIKLFNACVKSTLLFSCETWFVTNNLTNKLQVFVNRCLRSILGIWWPRRITNISLWSSTDQNGIDKDIIRRKYGWIGHTLRKDSEEIAHASLWWNPQGKRQPGRPKTTWRRTVANETKKTFDQLRYIARNRDEWKLLVNRLSS